MNERVNRKLQYLGEMLQGIHIPGRPKQVLPPLEFAQQFVNHVYKMDGDRRWYKQLKPLEQLQWAEVRAIATASMSMFISATLENDPEVRADQLFNRCYAELQVIAWELRDVHDTKVVERTVECLKRRSYDALLGWHKDSVPGNIKYNDRPFTRRDVETKCGTLVTGEWNACLREPYKKLYEELLAEAAEE